MKSNILKQIIEEKIACRAEIILIFEAFSKHKPQFKIIDEKIQVRQLNNYLNPTLQFKILDRSNQIRKVIEIFSIDKFQDDIFNIIEYAQKSKNLVRSDLIWIVFDSYYLDEDMLFYAVEYEDYDFSCDETNFKQNIELEQHLQQMYALCQQLLNPITKKQVPKNLSWQAYYIFQKQNDGQTVVKICTVDPFLFQTVRYCKYDCQIPSALKIKTHQAFDQLKQHDKQTIFQQIKNFSPKYLEQNTQVIEHIIRKESDLEEYELNYIKSEGEYFALNGKSANYLSTFQIQKYDSDLEANQKLEEFNQISQRLNEINIQVITTFEVLPVQQFKYLIAKTKQSKLNNNLDNFTQIHSESYKNLEQNIPGIPTYNQQILSNDQKRLSYLLLPHLNLLPYFPLMLPPPPLMLPPPPQMLPRLPPSIVMLPRPLAVPQYGPLKYTSISLNLIQDFECLPLKQEIFIWQYFELIQNLIKIQNELFKLKIIPQDIQVSKDFKLIVSENVFNLSCNSNNKLFKIHFCTQYKQVILNLLQLLSKLFTKYNECLSYKRKDRFFIQIDSVPFQILNQCITDYFYSYQNDDELMKKKIFDQLESYFKRLEIVINLNKEVEGYLFGISPFSFDNLSFIIDNQGNKSLKIVSKLLLENSNFDIVHFYSGFLFFENFFQLYDKIQKFIQCDYYIDIQKSLDSILILECFEDFSIKQKTKINNIRQEYRQIKQDEFGQSALNIQFCSCILEARKNSVFGLCLISNYVMNQSILGDDIDDKFICNCDMLNQITKLVVQNQKNLKVFKFQVYLCQNVRQQLQEKEDYFGLSGKLNLFLLEISYHSQKINLTNYRKLIFRQLKRNARNVSTLNLQEDPQYKISELNIFKKLKRVVSINII